MVRLEGGEFRMGSDRHYPGGGAVPAGPRRQLSDRSKIPVTNADFARFVAATGYVTEAERTIDPASTPASIPAC
ncbi:MAG: SUMF1/EgtB/PvdO family nonheme iron enzyme [Geminicoccaceae bacterium]